MRVTLGCAALNIALDFLLIPAHGAPGAALANGIAQSAAVFRRGVRGTAGRLLYWITPSEA